MKYFGAIVLFAAFFTIMVEGTYNESERVEISLHLVPMPHAQPELVERSLIEFDGVFAASLELTTSTLAITYDKAKISLSELEYLLTSMGYRSMPIELVQASM